MATAYTFALVDQAIRYSVVASLLVAALSCGSPRSSPVAVPDPPPAGPSPVVTPKTCQAYASFIPPVPASRVNDRCGWVPVAGMPSDIQITPHPEDRTAGRCKPISTTGAGVIVARVWHMTWGWFERDGRKLGEVSVDGLADLFLPQQRAALSPHLVTCNIDFKDQNTCYGSAAVESVAPDGTSATLRLDEAAPEWEIGGFLRVPLPPSASGMALAVTEWTAPLEAGVSDWRVRFRVVDEYATECGTAWTMAEGGPTTAARVTIAVDDHLRVLLLLERYFPLRLSARWFTIEGDPLTDEFAVTVPMPSCDPDCSWTNGQLYLTPLIGGGVAYQRGLQYLAVFPSGEPRYEPAPPWLTRMNLHNLYRVGDRGYAFIYLERPRAGDCIDKVEFVSAEGANCGRLTLESAAQCPEHAWVGRDGTVFLMPDNAADPCRFMMWDRLLQ